MLLFNDGLSLRHMPEMHRWKISIKNLSLNVKKTDLISFTLYSFKFKLSGKRINPINSV